jgi:hypothetical protein
MFAVPVPRYEPLLLGERVPNVSLQVPGLVVL